MLKTQTAPHPRLNCFQRTHQNKTLLSHLLQLAMLDMKKTKQKNGKGKKTAKPPFYMLCKCCSISLQ